MIKYSFLIGLFIGCFNFNIAQPINNPIRIDVGITSIPMFIDRTNAVRWMVFPTLKASLNLKSNIYLTFTYLTYDLRAKIYPNDDPYVYSETPELFSYEEALMYKGQRIGISLFENYIFFGIQHEYNRDKKIQLLYGGQLGYRFGESLLLSHVASNPNFPNGFEVHLTPLSNDAPGLNLFFSPRIHLSNAISIGGTVGTFIFANWPEFQPYLSVELGFSF